MYVFVFCFGNLWPTICFYWVNKTDRRMFQHKQTAYWIQTGVVVWQCFSLLLSFNRRHKRQQIHINKIHSDEYTIIDSVYQYSCPSSDTKKIVNLEIVFQPKFKCADVWQKHILMVHSLAHPQQYLLVFFVAKSALFFRLILLPFHQISFQSGFSFYFICCFPPRIVPWMAENEKTYDQKQ